MNSTKSKTRLSNLVWAYLAATGLLACSSSQDNESELKVGGRIVGSYKGYEQIRTVINDRLFQGKAQQEIDFILGPQLNTLLGAFPTGGTSTHFEGATPNPVNTLLWEILMDEEAAYIIDSSPSVAFSRAMSKISGPEGGQDEGLRELWQVVMRYDAPELERDFWVATVRSQEAVLNSGDPGDREKNILQSLLMNPYFLIEH